MTGAASGIGEAVAHRLRADGWSVVAVDRDAAGLTDFTAESDPPCASVVGDVADAETHQRARTEASAIGTLQAWISVAGITEPHDLHDLDHDSARRLIEVNQMGPLLGAAEAVTEFTNSGTAGVVVQISSVHASRAAYGYPIYEMTKAAGEALTRSIAVTYGHLGIRSIGIAPGAVETPALTESIQQSPDPVARRDRLAWSSPLGRMGQPSEIADVVAFAVSEQATFISGTTIMVDGAMTAVLMRRTPQDSAEEAP
ncbi:MAG: SDR family oxidoreductase [Ilumatobacteraceae bacterium]